MARFTVDYWRVILEQGADDQFKSALSQATGWDEDDKRRSFDHQGRVVRLRKVDRDGGLYSGEFTSIGVDTGGYRGDRQGKWTALDFEEDEGLGQSAVFVYSSSERVLALQRNRNAASSSVVGRFFRRVFPMLTEMDLVPIPTVNALQRFATLKSASKVEVAISGGTGAIPADADASVKEMVTIRQRIGVPVLRVDFSVSHSWRTKSARLEAVKKMVRSLLAGEGGDVDKLKVTGLTDDDERDIIDFATERIVDVVELKPDEKRNLSRSLRVSQIKEFLRDRKSEFRLE